MVEPIKDDNGVGDGMGVSDSPGQGTFRDGLFSSFTMILLAEIADKTFFIACIMAMRYNRLIVFAGAWGALVLMTLLSCVFGYLVTEVTSVVEAQRVVHYIAASLFLIFAIQMIWEGYKNRDTSARNEMEEVAAELRADDEELRVRFRDVLKIVKQKCFLKFKFWCKKAKFLVKKKTKNLVYKNAQILV